MMGTEIFNFDASLAEKLTKTRVSFLAAPTVYFILSHIVRYFFDAKILNKDARQFHFVSKVWRVSDGGGVRVRGQLRQQSGHRGRGGREGGRGQCLITPYLSLQYILQ